MQCKGMLRIFLLHIILILLLKRGNGQQGCTQTVNAGPVNCPQGYVASNGLCYLPNHTPNCCTQVNQAQNCCKNCEVLPPQPPATTTTSTTTIKPNIDETSTTPAPPAKTACPQGSILMHGKCRKIICPSGEYIAGRCRKAICPRNMVWRDHSCQERGFITTIIEIDNVIKTKTHETHGNATHTNENHTNYFNVNSTAPTTDTAPEKPKPQPIQKPKPKPRPQLPSPKPHPQPEYEPLPTEQPSVGCCSIYLPRTCRIFKDKWVCYNPKRKVCNAEICQTPTVYLKSPQIVEGPNFLVVPPSPQLSPCPRQGCGAVADFDCSGCARGQRETCAPYCYRYNCSSGGCAYVDWHNYCGAYPNQYGCTRAQGCKWNWCGGGGY